MNFSLENFELQFPGDLLLAGEHLYDNGAIKIFEEIEKNLWSFEIKERETFEVEILISPSKVLNYSCECNYYDTHKRCQHIVSALYFLRLQKTKKVEPNYTISRNIPKKLSIPNILSQVHPEDLKNFIKAYAKKNKSFATSLKANFARSIELEDNEYKYENILNAIIKPATSTSYRISYQTIRQFLNVADQYDAQFEDAISLKQYKEAYYIIKVLMSKLAYVNHWTLSEKSEIIELSNYTHKQFLGLLELEIPPSLEQKMVKFGMELANRSYYHVVNPIHNIYIILSENSKDVKKINALASSLIHKFSLETLHERELEKLWVIHQLFEEKGIAQELNLKPLLSSQAIYRICDLLEKNTAFIGLKLFLERFKEKGIIKELNLAKKYVIALSKLKDKENFISQCADYSVIHKDVFFYNVLKENNLKNQNVYFELITKRLLEKQVLSNQNLYLEILEIEDKLDDALEYVATSRYAFDLIKRFGQFLKTNEEKFDEKLIFAVDNYLNGFLGLESAKEIKNLLKYLEESESIESSKKVKKHILKAYKERENLIEEIKNF